MTRLASPIERIKSHYDVVVVGSGYGGAIAASRLSRAGKSVCVLERGKEFQPGEYPNTLAGGAREIQIDSPAGHAGDPTGLYDFRLNDDINVFVGCGLGGTSLVNANVSLPPDPRIFEDPRWPQAIRDDLPALLADGFSRAEEMLKPQPYPESAPPLAKLQGLQRSAESMADLPPGTRFYRPPINVNFEDRVNHVGVAQPACTLCGDCVSGCNVGAKNTVLMNYLPDAVNHGAEIFTEVGVSHVARHGDRWTVHFALHGAGRDLFGAPELFVSADVVVLAAGTLGSTEILLRSRERGLPLSDQLGHHFTGNGDVLGFGYNTDSPKDSIGWGGAPPGRLDPVGPCIAGIIDLRAQPDLEQGLVIEDGSAPGALAGVLPAMLATSSGALGTRDASHLTMLEHAAEAIRQLESLGDGGAYLGAARNTQVYLVMSHDDSSGEMRLENGRLRVEWPGVGEQDVFRHVNERLAQATAVHHGTYVPNFTWSKAFNDRLVTVHPLGGCVMADDASHGVVNHKGQVFAAAEGTIAHEGLYVSDGAVIPRSLGVNPLLTISALAERCTALIARDRGWNIDYALPSAPRALPERTKLGLRFTETMKGYYTAAGDDVRSHFEFTLSVIADDLDRMLAEASHGARMVGTVIAPGLSPDPLTVTQGQFNLFVVDPADTRARRMSYRMTLSATDGATYYFDGFKVIRPDAPLGLDMWADTTTLYITVRAGSGPDDPVLGQGVLTIKPGDFMRQITTLQIDNAANITERMSAQLRFASFFGGVLFEEYGGPLAKLIPHR